MSAIAACSDVAGNSLESIVDSVITQVLLHYDCDLAFFGRLRAYVVHKSLQVNDKHTAERVL